MYNLLTANYYSIKKQKTFWIFSLIAIFYLFLSTYLNFKNGRVPSEEANLTYAIRNSVADSTLVFILIPISIFLTSDFSSGVIKVIIAKGYSRYTYYFSKLITSFLMFMFIYVVYIVAALIFSGAIYQNYSFGNLSILNNIKFILLQIISILGLTSFFTAIAFLTKNDIATFLINMISVLALHIPLDIYDSIAKYDFHHSSYLWVALNIIYLNSYTLISIMIFKVIIIGIIYTILFSFLGSLAFKHSNL